MFINSEHLPQLFKSEDYTSDEQFERELDRLFLPAWHLIATTAELPRDGDFRTLAILGRPIIVWRSGGEFQAFLNVCPHRFSRITKESCGHTGDRLQCQYHGWEFDHDGNTRKIPDARSFKPMMQGALGLTKFRTETCGQLIFVALSEDAPSLRDYLGDVYAVAEKSAAANLLPAGSIEMAYDVNWKIKLENSLESYHLDKVHVATLGRTPAAEDCVHELRPRGTYFRAPNVPGNRAQAFLNSLANRLAHGHNNNSFEHWTVYPHVSFGSVGLFRWAEMVIPVSPTHTWNNFKLFTYAGSSGSLKSKLLCGFLARFGLKFFTRVAEEDRGIIHEVQQGHFSPTKPSDGVISVREERCFHFQEFIRRETSDAVTRPTIHRPAKQA